MQVSFQPGCTFSAQLDSSFCIAIAIRISIQNRCDFKHSETFHKRSPSVVANFFSAAVANCPFICTHQTLPLHTAAAFFSSSFTAASAALSTFATAPLSLPAVMMSFSANFFSAPRAWFNSCCMVVK